jgi:hypothetical protein
LEIVERETLNFGVPKYYHDKVFDNIFFFFFLTQITRINPPFSFGTPAMDEVKISNYDVSFA